ncbi:MAG: Cell shape-determining protein MreC [Candidatus Yanofskybacteria bacterium GW2011_GWA1_41_6]|uniref:Cell shape-determining protein MreC n=1 Tax=Candidatus Yanofskybacteria bacterium GW2011_GWA1_41_6 TaxID=1619020 RepID=A0A0G0ZIF0_9BACT|nr:MAG: Cell shape-determining protein MreC [Candidatus Yanofskybacteria bacterium GW2011_GWA1_41_6]
MKRFSIKLGFILLVAVIGAVFLNKYIVKDRLTFYPKYFINLGSYLFTRIENFGGFVKKIENFNRLANENDKLRKEQKEVLNLKAKIDNLENENDFLRRAARVSQKFDYPVVYAGIFNLNLVPTGYNVLLNKGAQDGVSEGDVVVTAEGFLVGKIQKVMRNFSRVLFVSDSEFKITVKVMSSGTAGIARGALGGGMYLDFIVQEDEIKEEDVLISTGSDLFPPALIIGSVDYIETNTTQIFKKVRIRPAIKDTQLSRVLVVKMK